jgi:uncharacterized membrane protein YfcA
MSALDVVVAILTGLVAGAFAGLLGVGGGSVMIPSMVLLLDQTQHVAAGTSLLVIVFTGIAGTVANRKRDLLDAPVAKLLGFGGILGAVLGAALALRVLEEETLRRIFGAFLIVVALTLLVRRAEKPQPH